jgi:short-subunit dehydrogenase
MNYFQDKVIWITGASSGIGAELGKQLAKAGALLILSARSEDNLNLLKSQLTDSDKHFVLPLDLREAATFEQIAQKAVSFNGKIDILINNGGISQRGEAVATPLEVDRKIMEVNFFGNIALTKVIRPYFRKQQMGHLVIVTSIAGKFGFYLRSAYSASKHALHGFYESLSLEEAKNNISVSLIVPGKINTPISLSALNEKGEAHGEMDHNQASGMPVQTCVKQILQSIEQKKRETLIGNKEIKAVTLKRFFPALFWRIIQKQSAT